VVTGSEELSSEDTSDKDDSDSQDPSQDPPGGGEQRQGDAEQEVIEPGEGKESACEDRKEEEVSEATAPRAPRTPSGGDEDKDDEDFEPEEHGNGKPERPTAEQDKGPKDPTLHKFFGAVLDHVGETNDDPSPQTPTQEGEETRALTDTTERTDQEGPTQQ